MRERKFLLSTLVIAASILAIVSAKIDLNKDKYRPMALYKVVSTCFNTQLITVNNDYVSTHIQDDGIWEPGVTRCILENVKPSDTVVEIGANIGYYTTIIAHILKRGSGKLISYEANEDVYKLAKASLIINGSEFKTQLKNLAVSDKEGQTEFSYYGLSSAAPTNLGKAHLTVQDDLNRKEWKRRMIECVSLDEDLANVPSIDLLRMNIEGSECLAIKGAEKLIRRSPNLKIIMEWCPQMLKHYCNVDKFLKVIRGYGFEAYIIDDKYMKTGKMRKLSDKQLKNANIMNILLKRD